MASLASFNRRFQPQTHKAFCKLPGLRKSKGKVLTCQNQHKDITSCPVKSCRLCWYSRHDCCFLSHCPATSRCFCFLMSWQARCKASARVGSQEWFTVSQRCQKPWGSCILFWPPALLEHNSKATSLRTSPFARWPGAQDHPEEHGQLVPYLVHLPTSDLHCWRWYD